MAEETSAAVPVLPSAEMAKKKKVKPALKKHPVHGKDGGDASKEKKPKKHLKFDEKAIQEHDQLRGTRMKIDEPNTPFTHYESHSDSSDGELRRPRSPVDSKNALNWDHLSNKLSGVAAVRDACPPSPSSHASGDSDAEEERKRRLRHFEFQQHRKQHYNEFEFLKKYRQQHPDMDDDDENDENDDNSDEKKDVKEYKDGGDGGDGDDEMETS